MADQVFSFDDADLTLSEGVTRAKEEAAAPARVTWMPFESTAAAADELHPILTLSVSGGPLPHHLCGHFTDPARETCFAMDANSGAGIGNGKPGAAGGANGSGGGNGSGVNSGNGTPRKIDILAVDRRFVPLITWLGKNRITVRLSGKTVPAASGRQIHAVYRLAETDSASGKLSAADGFLQYAVERLLDSKAAAPESGEDDEEDSDELKLTSLQSMSDYLDVASGTLPSNIRKWARRNLAIAKSEDVTQEERRHAQHALSVMLNIRWKDSTFGDIDPVKARAILDEALYGMDRVKQRIIETIIQINRTHRLPAYGLLLVGPAGTGKSQIAYTVARILGLPWTSLDMSSIHDAEQLTGSSRVYSNAKPGSIMEAFSMAGESNLVFIINELDKADSKTTSGNPADALLTLLDNLGFTDNYMECTVPTDGIYPIATANDIKRISEPLMTRFAVIEIPDYTPEEKKTIFLDYALPKVLKRMGLKAGECVISEDAARAVVARYEGVPGVRDLEQAAEHLAANALYRIETTGVTSVTFDAALVREVLE